MQRQIQQETLPAGPLMHRITSALKPRIETLEKSSYERFEPLVFYISQQWNNFDKLGVYIWIKVEYDDGYMHVKVAEVYHRITKRRTFSLIDYETGKTLDEVFSIF